MTSSYVFIRQCVWVVNLLITGYVIAFSICYWANYTKKKTKLSRKSENAVADDRVLKFLYVCIHCFIHCLYSTWLTSWWILSAMSPEIQEWSHKSRSSSRISNLYLLTRPIFDFPHAVINWIQIWGHSCSGIGLHVNSGVFFCNNSAAARAQ